MGSWFSRLQRCHCHQTATYRCQYHAQVDDIEDTYMRAPKQYPELLKYWNAMSGPYHQYVACDRCIRVHLIGNFTRHSTGWSEGAWQKYETIKL